MKRKILWVSLATALCTSVTPGLITANDGKNAPPSKAAPTKRDAPLPLTERERWLLDRMEQLEKRVAELESKSSSSAEGIVVGNVATENAPDNSAVSEAVMAASTSAVPADSTPLSKNPTAVARQATEKGKAGKANPSASATAKSK